MGWAGNQKGGIAMQGTRQAILNILKENGQATVDQLSDYLNLTPVTIRHHLDILRSEGLVQAPKVKRRQTPGRPQHIYSLTEQASSFFPKNYVDFANLTLLELRDRVGAEEVDSIARGVARRMAADAPRPMVGEVFSERLRRVVEFLNKKGYVARWESNGQGYLVHMANCPYQGLTQHHAAPCIMDMALITELLGTEPERIAWASAGDDACAYMIHEPSRAGQVQ